MIKLSKTIFLTLVTIQTFVFFGFNIASVIQKGIEPGVISLILYI